MHAGTSLVTHDIWLREGPGTNYEPIALIPKGSTFEADGSESRAFAHGSFGPLKGWASMAYLFHSAGNLDAGDVTTATAAEVQNAENLQLTGQDVAFRTEPKISTPAFGPGSNVIVTTNQGEVAKNGKIQDDGFQSVNYKGVDGWISVLYLKPTNAAPTPGPIPQMPIQPAPAPAPKVQTEIGPMTGGALALGLLALGAGIYFLAK
jgi:hypothetical protein